MRASVCVRAFAVLSVLSCPAAASDPQFGSFCPGCLSARARALRVRVSASPVNFRTVDFYTKFEIKLTEFPTPIFAGCVCVRACVRAYVIVPA